MTDLMITPETVADAIERSTLIRAPRERVWRALTSPAEFGAWFGARLSGAFAVGGRVEGQITICNYEHVRFAADVVAVEPMSRLAFTWHPFAVDPAVDYTQEEPTLVEFFLEDKDGATLLRVIESGFGRVPAHRRAEAFRMNSGGWPVQLGNIARYVEAQS